MEDVIEYYDKGGNIVVGLDAEIHELHLTIEEKLGLLEFLKALTGVLREGM